MLRVIILTHGGAEALVNRLARISGVEITGIIVETPVKPQRTLITRISRSLKYEGYFATVKKFISAIVKRPAGEGLLEEIADKQRHLETFAAERNIPFYRVDDYHSASSAELIDGLAADLGVLYGTNIIRESVFNKPRLGSINLHQGLAPLYRGGPTVFWELFNGESELGITVHFVVADVDSGDIVLQRKIPLRYDFDVYGDEYEKFLSEYRRSLKEPSVELIAEAIEKIASGDVQTIKQDLSLGKRYRLPTKREKDGLRRRLRQRSKASMT